MKTVVIGRNYTNHIRQIKSRPLLIPCTGIFLFILILDTFPTFHFTF